MEKLKLKNIKKVYIAGEAVTALKDVSISFRSSEFVSILGPSGCGKTTLLNIIGGLDRYTRGDLIINGVSTSKFKDREWDAYRNTSIGFVFQNYNLISHQSVLQNVEIALTLSGVSKAERRKRAKKALDDVGLSDQIKKRPNQLSGGQMQRVAIARALVNDPDIVLADEPTGALDSKTSVQIMEILKEVAKTRLVIMVTHNSDLADKYSSRIISLLDGEITNDTNPLVDDSIKEEEKVDKKSIFKKTSMSLFTAIGLSFKNLMTKKGRTIITAFAGSIGIIGVALVLALSNGLSQYMNSMQSETLSNYPLTIDSISQEVNFSPENMDIDNMNSDYIEYPTENRLYSYDMSSDFLEHKNILNEDYLEYIGNMENDLSEDINSIAYNYGLGVNLLANVNDDIVKFDTNAVSMNNFVSLNSFWNQIPKNDDFILSMYDLIGDGSRLPENKNEVIIVVDKYNRIDKGFFEKLGLMDAESYDFTDFIGKDVFKVISNNNFYENNGNIFLEVSPNNYDTLSGENLKVVGVLRPKEDMESGYLSTGIGYTSGLMDFLVEDAESSEIADAQRDSDISVLQGTPFVNDDMKEGTYKYVGSDILPTGINIYPKNYESKDNVKEYLDDYNEGKEENDRVIYSDMAEMITSFTGTFINTVTYVLVGFASISLVVSTIMISIITYVSVIERTKEIGILRSVGARKKDISRVFNAETLIIGFMAGVFGVGVSYLLTYPINSIIFNLVSINNIASLNPIHGVILIVGSIILTIFAGFIPSRIAAKKDPVEALRTE